jgi:hypothetical protein
MTKRLVGLSGVLIASALTVLAQSTSPDQPTGERLIELLRHPNFFTLRLSTPNYSQREKPTDTPAPFSEGDSIDFQLFMTQNSSSSITVWTEADFYFAYRPELMRDGEILPYTKEAKAGVKTADTQPYNGSGAPHVMEPGREYVLYTIILACWYKPLQPGRYQLIVRKRFVWDGDWVGSNPVVFDVLPGKLP